MSKIGVSQIFPHFGGPNAADTMIGDHYFARVLATRYASLIAYFPLWHFSATQYDLGPNQLTGSDANWYTLHSAGNGDGHAAHDFDGESNFVDIYSATLNSLFNGNLGTVMFWAKVYDADVWTDGSVDYLFTVGVDNNNYIAISKPANNTIRFIVRANGSLAQKDVTTSTTAFFCVALTWSRSSNRVRPYFNGVKQGADIAGIGVWTGSLSSVTCNIGSYNTNPTYPWFGYIAHAALWSAELSATEIAQLSRV